MHAVNFATRADVSVDEFTIGLLSRLDTWMTVAELAETLALHGPIRELSELLEQLAEGSLLLRSDVDVPAAEAAADSLRSWNPAAGFFHAATTRVTFADPTARAVTKAALADPPRRSPRPSRLVRLELGPRPRDPFAAVLLQRRTYRHFGTGALSKRDFSTLAWLTAGVQGWLHTPRGERLKLKTSPSGGARHPIETYFLIRKVAGIRAGLYRYDGERHALTGIEAGPERNQDYLPRQYWYNEAAVVALFCARYDRTYERYKFSRAYRAVLVEAGHVAQTFCLVATSLKLAPFSTMALDDERIERDLGLDGIRAGVVYAAGAGPVPKGGCPSAPNGQSTARIEPHLLARLPRGAR